MNRRSSEGRPRSLQKEDRAALDEIEQHLRSVYDMVDQLGPGARERLKTAAMNTSETNCGWLTYDAANLALDALRMTEPKAVAGSASAGGD